MKYFMNDPYLIEYDNIISTNLCDSLISKFDLLVDTQMEKINDLSICYKNGKKLCKNCNCTRINLMEHSIFKEEVYQVAHITNNLFKTYIKDTNSEEMQFPSKYNFESIKMKKYLPNTDQQFKTHIDVDSWKMAKRFLAFVYYLNDNFDGGETVFPKHNIKIKPKKGKCVVFPPYWPWIHAAEKVTGNNSKYFMGTYLTYVEE